MEEAGFKGIGTYVTRRQNMVTQYTVTRPILDICERSAQRPRAGMSQRWWEQDGLDFEAEKKRVAEELDGEDAIGKEERISLETTTDMELGRGYKVANSHTRGTELSDLTAAVLGWNTTTQ